jgi:hypothetical protein
MNTANTEPGSLLLIEPNGLSSSSRITNSLLTKQNPQFCRYTIFQDGVAAEKYSITLPLE